MGKKMDESAPLQFCVNCGQRTFLPTPVLGHMFCGDCLDDFHQQMARSDTARLAIQFRPDNGDKRARKYWLTLRAEGNVIPMKG